MGLIMTLPEEYRFKYHDKRGIQYRMVKVRRVQERLGLPLDMECPGRCNQMDKSEVVDPDLASTMKKKIYVCIVCQIILDKNSCPCCDSHLHTANRYGGKKQFRYDMPAPPWSGKTVAS